MWRWMRRGSLQVAGHDEMRLVRVDGALLVEEVSGYLCSVAEDEALAEYVDVHDVSVQSGPVGDTDP